MIPRVTHKSMFNARSPGARPAFHVCCMVFLTARSTIDTRITAAAVLLIVVLAGTVANSAIRNEVNQGTRVQSGPPHSGIRTYRLPVRKSHGVCRNNNECNDDCCCVERQHVQTCQPYSLFGERCTISQIRGGVYHSACPCAAGNQACKNDTCK
ncbi:uncharacterized protein LOC142587624 [Dermacentor variabilis]|uniref:uncharacterized protein LOC142587624 n=1 Tax=Dermacentor variabilis TaxID=34621 RepID=UPI003F5BE278